MSVKTDIENKEKSLAELMVKILKEPLNPLERAMDNLREDILDTKDQVVGVNDAIYGTTADTDKKLSSLKQSLKDIKDESIPASVKKLQEHISTRSKGEAENIISSHERQLKASAEGVLDELRQNRQVGEKSAQDLSRQWETVSQSIDDAVAISRDSAAKHQRALQERDALLFEKLDSIIQAQQELKQSIEDLYPRLDGVNQGVQTAHNASAQRFETNEIAVLAAIKETSARIQTSLAENLGLAKQVNDDQRDRHADLIQAMSEQQIRLEEKIESGQGKLRYFAVSTGLFLVAILAYIGYDIWKNFN